MTLQQATSLLAACENGWESHRPTTKELWQYAWSLHIAWNNALDRNDVQYATKLAKARDAFMECTGATRVVGIAYINDLSDGVVQEGLSKHMRHVDMPPLAAEGT